MKKKIRVLASSLAAIAVSASIITGSTYALFTSESEVNIAASSAKVDVKASVAGATLYTPTSIDMNTYAVVYDSGMELALPEDGSLALDNLAPGDKVVVNLKLESASTVNYLYRVSLAQKSGDKDFYDNLLVGVDGAYYSEFVSEWKSGSSMDLEAEVEITVPAYLSNEFQNKSCELAFKVEAVQGNASVTNDTSKRVYPVYSQADLDEALDVIKDGETIMFMQKLDADIVKDGEVSFTVKGGKASLVKVNAADSSIDYYVQSTDALDVSAVASNSLHVYGEVKSLNLKQGRVVVENSASVEAVAMSPALEQVATLRVENEAVAKKIEVLPSEGIARIENLGCVESLNASIDSNAVLDNTGSIDAILGEVENVCLVTNEAELTQAVANGGYIRLIADFETSQIIDITKDTELDGDGHTIVSKANRILWISQSNVDVALKDVKLLRNGNNAVERAVQVNLGITGVKLTMDRCVVEASYYAINICNDAEVDLTITNSEITGWGAINAWSAGYSIHISDSILRGVNDKSYNAEGWNGFGTVVLEGDTTYKTELGADSVDVELKNCRIIAESKTGNIQKCILFNPNSKGNRVNVIDCTFELENENCVQVIDNGTDNNLIIYDSKAKTALVSGTTALFSVLNNDQVEEVKLLKDIDLLKDEK